MNLLDISTKAPAGLDRQQTKLETQRILEELDELQNLLYAENKHSLLVILQGMDASGKDGAIKSVFGSLNPQGVKVISFKVPTEAELAHDFLWRIHTHAPGKGMIQVFNRSHYESVLVARVHGLIDDETVRNRMRAINDFERLLSEDNSTAILKFYLHISEEEQHERLIERKHDIRKQWKFNENDFAEAKLWPEYRKAYEDCLVHCNKIPWVIVPADQNWYKEYLIASKIHETLKSFDMKYPGLKKQ